MERIVYLKSKVYFLPSNKSCIYRNHDLPALVKSEHHFSWYGFTRPFNLPEDILPQGEKFWYRIKENKKMCRLSVRKIMLEYGTTIGKL